MTKQTPRTIAPIVAPFLRGEDAPGGITQNSLLPFDTDAYEPPSSTDVRIVMRRLGFTGTQVAALVGVDGRTVRKWAGAEREMPYSVWRLLLIAAGLVEPPKVQAAS